MFCLNNLILDFKDILLFGDCMKYFIRLIFAIFLLFNGVEHCIAKINFTADYNVLVNNKEKGAFTIKYSDNKFSSRFYNIKEDDRIPFYSEKKEGFFKESNKAVKLSVDDNEFSVYYDLKSGSVPEQVLDYILGDKTNRSVIVNDKINKPILSFDRIPLVTIENIIYAFMKGKIKENKKMILFEPGSKTKFRIYFEKEKTLIEPINYSDYKCNGVIRFYAVRTMSDKDDQKIFSIDVTNEGIPITISSLSRRWEFRINQLGEEIINSYDTSNDFLNIAEEELSRRIGNDYKLTVNKTEINNAMMKYDFSINSKPMEKIDRIHYRNYLFENLTGSTGVFSSIKLNDKLLLKNIDDKIFIIIPEKVLCADIKISYNYESCNYKKINKSVVYNVEDLINYKHKLLEGEKYEIKNKYLGLGNDLYAVVLNSQNEKITEVEFRPIIKVILETKLNNSEVDIYNMERSYSDRSQAISIQYAYKENIQNYEYLDFAANYFYRQIMGYEGNLNRVQILEKIKKQLFIENEAYIYSIERSDFEKYLTNIINLKFNEIVHTKLRGCDANVSCKDRQCWIYGTSSIDLKKYGERVKQNFLLNNKKVRNRSHEVVYSEDYMLLQYPIIKNAKKICN